MAFNHDKRYKRIFSNPYFLQKLLESFVHEDFIHKLDFTTLKPEIDRIIGIIKKEQPNVLTEFANWFNNYLSYLSGLAEKDTISLKIEDIMEVRSMLATKMKAYNLKLIEQGIEQGKKTLILKMIDHGVPSEKIAEQTGLTVDEVRKYLEK